MTTPTAPAPHESPRGAASGTSQHPTPSPPFEPARRLVPDSGHRWLRRVLAVLGASVVVLTVAGLAASSFASWRTARDHPQHETLTALGLPASLEVSVDLGTVRVLESTEVSEVSVGMTSEGSRFFADGQDVSRAEFTVTEGEAATVDVRQPNLSGPADAFRDRSMDVLVLVPEGHELDLTVRADVGDVDIEGAHSSIDASVDVGDLDIELPVDATIPVTAAVDLGDLRIAAPGTTRYDVSATTDAGEARVDEAMRAAAGEAATRISAEVSVGEVSVSR